MLPDGIIGSQYGPVDGRRHDAFLLNEGNVTRDIEQKLMEADHVYYLYGDPAYPLQRHIIVPFKGHNLDRARSLCNKRMSRVRECVEWGFGKIITIFAFLEFKKNLKLQLQPVADYYKVGALLTNCHTCVYGSQTTDFFGVEAPRLEEYLVV